jgi:acyl dehydratase
MPVDREKALEYPFAPLAVTIDRARLVFFAKATGQRDPVYSDLEAARRRGYPDLPIPPSFSFSLDLERPEPLGWLSDLGADLADVLHGEQSFTHHAMAFAGQLLTLESMVTDLQSRKGGELQIITRQTRITRAGEPITDAISAIVVRNRTAAAG